MKGPVNILVMTYWGYEDPLVQAYTLPYVSIISRLLPEGSRIFLVTMDKTPVTSATPSFIHHISLPYYPFGLRSAGSLLGSLLRLKRLIKKEDIRIIHAWCTPAGMLANILSRITGTGLIIDSYEPHADAMVENGTWKADSMAYRILFRAEKAQTRRAKFLIACASGMKDYARERYSHTKDNFFVKPACVDLDKFSSLNRKKPALVKELGLEDKIVCVYAGKLGGIYLDREVFSFFRTAQDHWGSKFRVLLLSPNEPSEITAYSREAGLAPETVIHRFIPHAMIADYMGLADFAITPVKPVPSKRYCTPIKDGEYWALGLPVVITPGISDDSGIIAKNKIGSILEGYKEDDLKKSVREIDALLSAVPAEELYSRIRKIAEEYRNFRIAEDIYKRIYSGS